MGRKHKEVPFKHVDPKLVEDEDDEELDEGEMADYDEQDIKNRIDTDWEKASGLSRHNTLKLKY